MFSQYTTFLNNVLDYSSVERKVIANNISNFNTPNFKAKHLDFKDVFEQKLKTELITTNERHISNNNTMFDIKKFKEKERSTGSIREDGNNVDLTHEMIEMLKNNSLYSNGVNALNKEFLLYKITMGS